MSDLNIEQLNQQQEKEQTFRENERKFNLIQASKDSKVAYGGCDENDEPVFIGTDKEQEDFRNSLK